MKTTRTRHTNRQPKHEPGQDLDTRQFEEMPDPRDVVEHLTIPGFIRRAPHRFHLDELTRFGDKVARVAESLQVSYLTTVDSSLGVIRLFPVPLMVRVYQVMATQFHWNPYTEPLILEDGGAAQMLRSSERAKKHLQSIATLPENPAVTEAMAVVLQWLDEETRRLGGDPAPAPEPPAPLRAI